MKTETLFSRKSDEWETPDDVFASLDAEFHFDLDPCATQENHKCSQYYTADDNGLEKNWGGGECSAILPTAKFQLGCRSVTRNRGNLERYVFC